MRGEGVKRGPELLFWTLAGVWALLVLATGVLWVSTVGRPVHGVKIGPGTPHRIEPRTHTALDAGLAPRSIVRAAGTVDLSDGRWDTHRYVGAGLSTRLGDSNHFAIVTGSGEQRELDLPVHRYTWRDAAAFPGPLLLFAAATGLLAIVAFRMRPFAADSWALLGFGLCTGLTLVTYAHMAYMPWVWPPDTPLGAFQAFMDRAHRPVRWLAIASIPHLILAFPVIHPVLARRPRLPMLLYAILVVPGVLFVLVEAGRLLDVDPNTLKIQIRVEAFLLSLGMMTLWARLLVLAVRAARPIIRQRSRVLLAGALFGFAPLAGSLVSQVVLSAQAGTPAPYFYAPMILFPVALAYTVVRHELFDPRIAVRRGLAYLLAAGLAAVIVWQASAVSPALAAVLLLPLLAAWQFLHARLTKLLYPRRAQFPELHEQLARELAEAPSRRAVLAVLSGAPARVCETVGGAAFLLGDEHREPALLSVSRDPQVADIEGLSAEPLVQMLVAGRQPIPRERITVDERFSAIREQSRACMDRLGAAVLIPLERQGRVVGGLAVGPHARGDVHDPAAIDLLQSLGREAMRAVEVLELHARHADTGVRGGAAVRGIPQGTEPLPPRLH